jgi:hypothetical protein
MNRRHCLALVLVFAAAGARTSAQSSSGAVTSATGTISPKFSTAYVVRDQLNPRQTTVEVLLTDVAVNAAPLRDDLDRHVTAINLEPLRDRNYILLWVGADGSVKMNATYSKTMTQYLNDSAGGLKAEFTTNTASKIAGRVFSTAPLKTMNGPTYTVDLTFSVDVIPAPTGTALAAAGGDPGRALAAFVGAIGKKDWNAIKAGLSPKALPNFERSYNTPEENASSAIDILNARLPVVNAKVTGGIQTSATSAVLELEGERFGTKWMSLVRMVKTGAAWQFEESAPVGMLR